jgi:hypothetical protein
MKYQELLERFWDMDKDFSSTETLLYLYLLHRCNSYGWPDTFSLSNEELIERLKCRPTNFRVARNALVDAGLIRYYVGNGRGGISSYSIEGRSDVSKKGVPTGTPFEEKGVRLGTPLEKKRGSHGNTFSNVTTLESVNIQSDVSKKGVPTGTPFEELKEEKQEKKTFPPAPPIKEKKEKKKSAHTISAHTPMCANGQFTLFSEEAPPLKKKRNPVEPHLPKDIEEVVTFFEKYASDKLPEWKAEAELFFYHFDSVGWMGTSNRKIQDWESRANLWISDKALALKNGEQERRQTEIDARNLRPYGRTTGVPKEGGGGKMLPQPRVRECNEQDDTPKDYTKGF